MGKHIIAHSAKGSHWKKHSYIGIKDGKYVYADQNEAAVNTVADGTGMTSESIRYLNYLAKTKGFDSKEYKKEVFGLTAGDPDQERAVTDTLKRASAHRLTGSKTPIEKQGEKDRASYEDWRDKKLHQAIQKTAVSKGKGYVDKMLKNKLLMR